MLYKPDEEELIYIKGLREKQDKKKVITKSGSLFHLAAIPEPIFEQMSNQYGEKWFTKEKLVIQFLQKNPQYKVGKGY